MRWLRSLSVVFTMLLGFMPMIARRSGFTFGSLGPAHSMLPQALPSGVLSVVPAPARSIVASEVNRIAGRTLISDGKVIHKKKPVTHGHPSVATTNAAPVAIEKVE